MRKIELVFALCFLFLLPVAQAQQFVNGDLEGNIDGSSSLPDGWACVPYGDPVCRATAEGQATPDLTSATEPDPSSGIVGRPFSGKTFVSGAYATSGSDLRFQEGIQQTISGLVPGKTYEIDFYQAVVKQENSLDTTGCWIVYIDSKLAGSTKISNSHLKYNAVNLTWERRSISFVATKTKHTIKFLPWDDDDDQEDSETNKSGALRMGIDMISLTSTFPEEIAVTPNPVDGFVSIQNSTKSDVSFELLDENGKPVLSPMPLKRGLNEIDLGAQPDGIYIMRFVVEEKTYTLSYEKD